MFEKLFTPIKIRGMEFEAPYRYARNGNKVLRTGKLCDTDAYQSTMWRESRAEVR